MPSLPSASFHTTHHPSLFKIGRHLGNRAGVDGSVACAISAHCAEKLLDLNLSSRVFLGDEAAGVLGWCASTERVTRNGWASLRDVSPLALPNLVHLKFIRCPGTNAGVSEFFGISGTRTMTPAELFLVVGFGYWTEFTFLIEGRQPRKQRVFCDLIRRISSEARTSAFL